MKWYQWFFIGVVSVFLTVTALFDLTELKWVWEGKPAWKGTLGVMSGFAAFTGIICVIQVARGKISNYIYGFINVLLYGLYAFSVGYTGDALLNLFFFLPMQIIGFVLWSKHIKKTTVENNKMTIWSFSFYSIVLGLLWLIFYYLIPVTDVGLHKLLGMQGDTGVQYNYPFQGPTIPHLLDAFTNAASITAQILMLKRYKEQWILWIIINIAQITMYAGVNTWGLNIPMILMWGVFLLNSAYGFVLWSQREQRVKWKIEMFLGYKIKKYKILHGGFSSNQNYLVDDELHVHFSKNEIDHKSELEAYKLYKHELIKTEDGKIAKQYIPGTKPNLGNPEHLKIVLEEIANFHKLNPKGFPKHGIDVYLDTTLIDKELLLEFKKIKKEYSLEPKVLIHGDINPSNIVFNGNKATLIDLEWVRTGPAIIDFASITAFSKADFDLVSKWTSIKKDKLIRFTRFVLIHALMWCESQKTTDSRRLKKYINKKLQSEELKTLI